MHIVCLDGRLTTGQNVSDAHPHRLDFAATFRKASNPLILFDGRPWLCCADAERSGAEGQPDIIWPSRSGAGTSPGMPGSLLSFCGGLRLEHRHNQASATPALRASVTGEEHVNPGPLDSSSSIQDWYRLVVIAGHQDRGPEGYLWRGGNEPASVGSDGLAAGGAAVGEAPTTFATRAVCCHDHAPFDAARHRCMAGRLTADLGNTRA